MTETDKVQILFKEYDTLRTEILQRISHRFNFLTLVGGVGVFSFFNAGNFSLFQTGALATTAVGLLVVYFRLGGLVVSCSRHIANLEKQINTLAGEDLLSWEAVQAESLLHRIHK